MTGISELPSAELGEVWEHALNVRAGMFGVFLKIFSIFRERERQEERGRETSMCKRYIDQLPFTCPHGRTWPATQPSTLIGNRTGDLWVSRLASSPLSHASQGRYITE